MSSDIKIKVQKLWSFQQHGDAKYRRVYRVGYQPRYLFQQGGYRTTLAKLVKPMITYLLPLLIGYTGGKLVGGERGGVVGAITTMGVIVGADMPDVPRFYDCRSAGRLVH